MQLHKSYGEQNFEDDTCFLCGRCMKDNGSAEHVFPKWLLNRYGLWDQKIDLLNGSLMPYRQLTVPCCEECNNSHLSRIENQVNAAVKGGFQKAAELPIELWHLWAGKIFYGILRKELSLLLDRSSSKGDTIVTKKVLESFSNLHIFMQGFRGKHRFKGDLPYSVLVCNLHEFGSSYDFRDHLLLFTLAIRLGEIGIIISFEDGGLTRESYGRYVDQVGGRKLHPIQFYELFARVSYQVKLRRRPVLYLTQSHVDGRNVAVTEAVRSSTSLDDWDYEEFVELLRFHVSDWLSDNLNVEFVPPDRVSSWMFDEKGQLVLLPRDGWRTPNK